MIYSEFAKEEDIKKYLNNVSLEKGVEQSGIPVMYDEKSAYITKEGHSLIIGGAGSGKTQSIILPLVKLSLLAGESLVINDNLGEIYKKTANEFKARGYNVIVLDFNDAIYGNYWNPLSLVYDLYKEGNADKALNIIENIGSYIFTEERKSIDAFWINSANSLFIGISLYLCKYKNKEELTFNNIFSLAAKLMKEEEANKIFNEIGKDNAIYYNLSGILEAPKDTKGSIYAVFSQNIRELTSRENLSNMLSKSDFDLKNIANNKTVIFIINGYNSAGNKLMPILINQVVESLDASDNKKKFNIILDEFDKLNSFHNFAEMVNYSRGININFTVVISSYINLINNYGKEDSEIIKFCFSNIIYLYTNDVYTNEEISNLCGKTLVDNKVVPLVPVQELQTLKRFETIVLITRMLPFKSKLVADYEINWNLNTDEASLEKRK